MGKFNGPTPKRHRLFSNDRDFLQPIADAAGYMSRVEQSQCKVKTARSYHDKQGVRRHVGNKETLRDSQKLCFNPTICFFPWDNSATFKIGLHIVWLWWVVTVLCSTYMIQHLRTYTREFGQFVAKTIMEQSVFLDCEKWLVGAFGFNLQTIGWPDRAIVSILLHFEGYVNVNINMNR